ncbi:hypothetical protein BH09MYX1_BH09MYX1_10720 [soil metagenome]
MKTRIPLAASMLLAACASLTPPPLTPAGKNVVYVTVPAAVESCTNMGVVTIADPVTQSNASSNMKADEHDEAVIELKNAAAEKGGTAVFVDEAKTPSLEKGVVYKCAT